MYLLTMWGNVLKAVLRTKERRDYKIVAYNCCLN